MKDMVLLDSFYQIVERDTARVSFFWKVAHVSAFIGAIICGFITTFTFGQILADFNYNCVLDAMIVFDNNTNITGNVPGKKGEVTANAVDLDLTKWGSTSMCSFAQFTPLFTMICAIIWGTFFIILTRGGAGYASDLLSRPWGIVYPCLVFTVITIIVLIISSLKLGRGLVAFCEQFQSQFGNDGCVCDINIYSRQFHKDEPRLFFNFCVNSKLATVSADCNLWMWVGQLAFLVVRIFQVADFDIHQITVLPKEEEILEIVINPEQDEETSEV